MADNLSITPGTGATAAAEDVAGVLYSKAKLIDATAGSTTPTGVTANPLQVALPSATVTTLTPPAAITGFATSAKQLADGHNVAVNNSTGGAAVNVQDGGNTLTVDGSVTVTNSTATNLKAEAIGTKTNNAAVPGATNLGTLQGVANAAAPTWTETYMVAESMDLSGNQRITAGTLGAGENLTTNRLNNEPIYSYWNGVADAQIKAGAGTLHSVTFSSDAAATAGTLILSDALTETTPNIITITFEAAYATPRTLIFDTSFATGLYAGFTTTGDVSVCIAYR
jgi:hypothetical protein